MKQTFGDASVGLGSTLFIVVALAASTQLNDLNFSLIKEKLCETQTPYTQRLDSIKNTWTSFLEQNFSTQDTETGSEVFQNLWSNMMRPLMANIKPDAMGTPEDIEHILFNLWHISLQFYQEKIEEAAANKTWMYEFLGEFGNALISPNENISDQWIQAHQSRIFTKFYDRCQQPTVISLATFLQDLKNSSLQPAKSWLWWSLWIHNEEIEDMRAELTTLRDLISQRLQNTPITLRRVSFRQLFMQLDQPNKSIQRQAYHTLKQRFTHMSETDINFHTTMHALWIHHLKNQWNFNQKWIQYLSKQDSEKRLLFYRFVATQTHAQRNDWQKKMNATNFETILEEIISKEKTLATTVMWHQLTRSA